MEAAITVPPMSQTLALLKARVRLFAAPQMFDRDFVLPQSNVSPTD